MSLDYRVCVGVHDDDGSSPNGRRGEKGSSSVISSLGIIFTQRRQGEQHHAAKPRSKLNGNVYHSNNNDRVCHPTKKHERSHKN